MSDIIEVAFHVRWRVPVFVRAAGGVINTVHGPDEAIRSLSTGRLDLHGSMQRLAKSRCLLALRRQTSDEDARDAFVASCQDAGTLL